MSYENTDILSMAFIAPCPECGADVGCAAQTGHPFASLHCDKTLGGCGATAMLEAHIVMKVEYQLMEKMKL